MKLTEKQLENVKLIQSLLANFDDTFDWHNSPQGFDFWDNVNTALSEIIKTAEKKTCKECGREL